MSKSTDEIMLEDMKKQDYYDILFESDVSGHMIDMMSGLDETTDTYEEDCGMLFPQPIRDIEI